MGLGEIRKWRSREPWEVWSHLGTVSTRFRGADAAPLGAGCVRETAGGQVPIKLLQRAVLEVLTGTFVVSEVMCGQGW
jgi:hypothetical protein